MTIFPEQSQADRVLAKFVDEATMAAETGLPAHVIRHAKRTGFFRQTHHPLILARALEHGRDVTAFDFIAHLVTHRIPESATG
jgi:hypothetical protein